MTTGIHHVTAITRDVQKNVDFYAGFLGLRLVKQTGGYEDAEQLHLFYGDALGSPGSIVTFLVWQDGAPGRAGLGALSEIALAVPVASLGAWLTRAMTAGVPVGGPTRELGESVLRLRDPDGIVVKLVGVDAPADAPLAEPNAPTRIHGVTILSEDAQATADFVARFGYGEDKREGPFIRLRSDRDVVDVRASAGFVPAIPGTGQFDHVAFRARDGDAVRRMRLELRDHDGVTNVHDRKYFLSLYVREPMGTLFEYATDVPGFTVDETPEHLGETLMIPATDAARAAELRVKLPQFARPGEERRPMRDLPFVHRFHTPENPDGSVIVLLHGTGGNEADLMPLAAQLNPRATLLGVRGRSTEEGITRWFRRFDAVTYDQDDIRAEAEAFAGFVEGAISGYGLDPQGMAFLGYSNGANLLGAILRLHPGAVRRAILLRGIEALEDAPEADLKASDVLLLTGAQDPFGRMAPALEASLKAGGAAVDARVIDAGHELSAEDLRIAADWLASRKQGEAT
ncbi:ring-cleaving dioxygenase [Aquicoccus porphyridii]|uniref:Ring-cleaving dioxygenase n=1 Tax=Aquicoccus porphyridii TaxID=1852029 RepID=A0A5A9ZCC0_9RHOB|nr:VOC family protein [Aquicoccus porphyridii]KAA0914672.1 ring-cleaving dioxygenase [Aquicoccus porphyridii]RAI53291.1 ring-cleaving dioxygenase [Rhodobacteraceae bacterium AsT-22]